MRAVRSRTRRVVERRVDHPRPDPRADRHAHRDSPHVARERWCAVNTPEGILTDPIPTAAQNLATLLLGDGDDEISKTFLLAEVTRGVFTAQVWRFDYVENDEPCSDPLEITFDSTGMQGGEMFHDL